MNREEMLGEIRRLLEKEPTVQRKWVWEYRARILEYLIARYGPLMLEPGSECLSPPLVPPSGGIHKGRKSPSQVRRILEEIAQLNARSRQDGAEHFPDILKN